MGTTAHFAGIPNALVRALKYGICHQFADRIVWFCQPEFDADLLKTDDMRSMQFKSKGAFANMR
jgi:hypothetical protein